MSETEDPKTEIQPQDEAVLTDHEYDGIRELDNPLPDWWLFIFLASIIFSFFYYIHFHTGDVGLSSSERLDKKMAAIQQMKEKAQAQADAKLEKVSEADLKDLVNDEQALAAGKQAYTSYCQSCHGAQGGGGIGPNLTDKYWIHGQGGMKGIIDVIRKGVTAKGMPAWGEQLPLETIQKVAAYVKSLQGTNPPDAKKPEGDPVN